MELILNGVHGRNGMVPEALDSPVQLLHVAVAIDKYDCFVPLAFAARLVGRCEVAERVGLRGALEDGRGGVSLG